MKNNFIAIAIASIIILAAGCKKSSTVTQTTPAPTSANVQIAFSNNADGIPLSMGALNYTNAANNKYSVSLLKYYVSNIELIGKNGTNFKVPNYTLVDLASAQNNVTLANVPAGEYTAARFYIGIDSARNHTGVQDGFLDPSYGMLWTWNTGYIFFKHEGQYLNSSSVTSPLRLHLGTDGALAQVNVPVALTVNGSERKIELQFNLNTAYHGISDIDFNTDNNRQSTSVADATWIANMKANLASAFTINIKQ